jgi:hypothetical protein
VRYTTVKLYQPVPMTCIQPVQLPYNQSVPELNLYQQNTIGTRHVVLQHAYVRTLSVMQPDMYVIKLLCSLRMPSEN